MTEQDDAVATAENEQGNAGSLEGAAEPKFDLKVEVEKTGDCQRHVTVEIAQKDVERYLDNTFQQFVPEAAIPGFRPGRAPRKLVQHRFRDEINDQTKARLIAESLDAAMQQEKLSTISEPDFDFSAIILPEDGPMVYEFDVEVRPEFDLPAYKGTKIQRPVWSDEYVEEKVEASLRDLLFEAGSTKTKDGPAALGDLLVVTLSCKHDNQTLLDLDEVEIILRPTLTLTNAEIADFGDQMVGAKEGDTRSFEVKIDAERDPLNGQTVKLDVTVESVEELEIENVSDHSLGEIGQFETVEEVRHAIAAETDRQLSYRQRQEVRRAIAKLLTESANWTLPPGLLKRQFEREFHRYVMELQTSGFSKEDIRRMQHDIRRKSMAHTEQALKEHFILERIAEENNILPNEQDVEEEVGRLSVSMKMSPRRVRARLEREGLVDTLRNQIVENKVLDQIAGEVDFEDEPVAFEPNKATVLELGIGSGAKTEEESEAVTESAPSDESAS